VEKENKFIEEYFHSKRGFRHLWEQVKDPKLKIKIPEGYITENKTEAIEAAWWFRNKNRDFVLKINRGVQGIGVLINHCADFHREHDPFVKYLVSRITDGMWEEPIIIVEEYIDPDKSIFGGSPNVEMKINRKGNVNREFACAQVLDADGKTFMGVAMNKEVESSIHIQEAYKAAELLAAKLTEVGYRGVFDVDLVVSKRNRLYAVEANMRRTGGTHAHEFVKYLLGDDYFNHYYVHFQDVSVPDNKKGSFFKSLEKFAYNKQTFAGIIPVNPDMMEVGKAPILIIAPDKQTLGKILGEINED
jgi:glutathione synthase/RimK-type ligase-like ATP-grasp enzyme